MSDLQRFSVVEHVDSDSDVVVVDQDPQGSYVDAEEALARIAELEAKLKKWDHARVGAAVFLKAVNNFPQISNA